MNIPMGDALSPDNLSSGEIYHLLHILAAQLQALQARLQALQAFAALFARFVLDF